MQHPNAYETLPEGYEAARVIDAKDKKTIILMNIAAVVIMALITVTLCLMLGLSPLTIVSTSTSSVGLLISWAGFMIMIVAYIVLHELTHGAAYKLLTKHKLTFGLTLSVAYCGVPDLYVTQKTALISVLAPFVVWNIIFALAVILFTDPLIRFFAIVLLALHVSGCIGDLTVTKVLLFDFPGQDLLMNDTGPKQTFYVKK